ncbi:MAG: hypothetical protein JW778_04305 [Candidatus Altiarchaeota archaeon]|nr:hypothetical protein [Candidatus Altiarchaeota archaeon]
MQEKHFNYLVGLVTFVVIASVILCLQFMKPSSEETSIVGRITASPAESATTFTALAIVLILIWFTFIKQEQET